MAAMVFSFGTSGSNGSAGLRPTFGRPRRHPSCLSPRTSPALTRQGRDPARRAWGRVHAQAPGQLLRKGTAPPRLDRNSFYAAEAPKQVVQWPGTLGRRHHSGCAAGGRDFWCFARVRSASRLAAVQAASSSTGSRSASDAAVAISSRSSDRSRRSASPVTGCLRPVKLRSRTVLFLVMCPGGRTAPLKLA